jgi:hypothetical protein
LKFPRLKINVDKSGGIAVSRGSKPNRDLMLLFFLIINAQNIYHLKRKIQRRDEREMDNADQSHTHTKKGTLDRRKEQINSLAHDVF